MSVDLEAICAQVELILVDTFGFSKEEAKARLDRWRERQHFLEGQALESLLPLMTPEQRATNLARWVLEGQRLPKGP